MKNRIIFPIALLMTMVLGSCSNVDPFNLDGFNKIADPDIVKLALDSAKINKLDMKSVDLESYSTFDTTKIFKGSASPLATFRETEGKQSAYYCDELVYNVKEFSKVEKKDGYETNQFRKEEDTYWIDESEDTTLDNAIYEQVISSHNDIVDIQQAEYVGGTEEECENYLVNQIWSDYVWDLMHIEDYDYETLFLINNDKTKIKSVVKKSVMSTLPNTLYPTDDEKEINVINTSEDIIEYHKIDGLGWVVVANGYKEVSHALNDVEGESINKIEIANYGYTSVCSYEENENMPDKPAYEPELYSSYNIVLGIDGSPVLSLDNTTTSYRTFEDKDYEGFVYTGQTEIGSSELDCGSFLLIVELSELIIFDDLTSFDEELIVKKEETDVEMFAFTKSGTYSFELHLNTEYEITSFVISYI